MLHCCQHDSFSDPSCNFRDFMHDFSQGPSSNSHGSVQHYIIAALLQVFLVTCAVSCYTVSMTLFSLDPSCNFHGFVHDFSLGLLYSCHCFVLHTQHNSSLDLLDNPPSFCQPSSDRLPRSTTPRILHVFILVLSSCVHTC